MGLAIGAFFGVRASSLKSDAACNDAGVCQQFDKVEDAKSAATVSTVGLTIGGALLAGGIVLVILAPPRGATPTSQRASLLVVSPSVGAGRADLALSARF